MKYSKELHEKWRKREDTSAMFRGNGEEAIILAPELDALLDEIERLQNENALLSAEVRDYDALREQISDPKPEED